MIAMKKIFLMLMLALLASPAAAQELFINGGVMRNSQIQETGGQWSVMYRQDLGKHMAFGFSYINEAHRSDSYRDGLSAQIWGHTNISDLPLSLSLGIGPYAYFDTRVSSTADTYENAHGFGLISSAAATWYGISPWLFQMRIDYIANHNAYNTLSATAGIGYRLEGSTSPGFQPPPAGEGTSENEITLYLGQSILNSDNTEHSFAGGIEYRRSLATYIQWTVALLHEGDTRPLSRYGITTQLWAVRTFLYGRLDLGIGAGPYLAQDNNGDGDGKSATTGAGDVSITTAYRFHPRLAVRATWNRIITDYSRDTDLFMGGLAYRF